MNNELQYNSLYEAQVANLRQMGASPLTDALSFAGDALMSSAR
jgi:hypothetical protein